MTLPRLGRRRDPDVDLQRRRPELPAGGRAQFRMASITIIIDMIIITIVIVIIVIIIIIIIMITSTLIVSLSGHMYRVSPYAVLAEAPARIPPGRIGSAWRPGF